MTKKKTELNLMLDGLGSAVVRQKLVKLIDDEHYKIASSLSKLDPMFSENLFKRLRDAVGENDADRVFTILDELQEFDTTLACVRRTLQDVSAVIRWGIDAA